VAHTLRNVKPLPPVTWNNWWKELEYVSTGVIVLVPLISLYGALTVELKWQTAVWSVAYYFITGLGKSGIMSAGGVMLFSNVGP
jgi:stearoyl-CoA desaturase (delta-9 desaturase)